MPFNYLQQQQNHIGYLKHTVHLIIIRHQEAAENK